MFMQLVCFDVDSTFCTDESIDELAAYLGKGDAVKAVTQQAMTGTMLFQDALKLRLDAMGASLQDVRHFKRDHPWELSPGVHCCMWWQACFMRSS
jgi:phosphoserine phosphatase